MSSTSGSWRYRISTRSSPCRSSPSSKARMIPSRDRSNRAVRCGMPSSAHSPGSSGSGTSTRPTLVDSTNESRSYRPSTFPYRFSLRPLPYRGAVSKYLIPTSCALAIVSSANSYAGVGPVPSAGPRPAINTPPRPRRVTSAPSFPTGTVSNGFTEVSPACS